MRSLCVAFFLFCTTFLFSVENSIIPSMEKFERVENLIPSKYSTNQFAEIVESLKKKEEKIRLATFNILFPHYDHNLEAINRWPNRLPRLLEVVKEMNCDILAVQEMYPEQIGALTQSWGEEYELFSKQCKDGENNGIFYRKSRFDLHHSMSFDVDGETLNMVLLEDKKTRKCFAVFNTHFAFSDVNRREKQAKFVAGLMKEFSKQIPVLFTGDLNTFPQRLDLGALPFYDGDYLNRILKSSLCETMEGALLGHLGPISTFTNEGTNPVAFKGTGCPGVILDHIYASERITTLIHAVEPATVGGHFPSDHMPVVIDFLVR